MSLPTCLLSGCNNCSRHDIIFDRIMPGCNKNHDELILASIGKCVRCSSDYFWNSRLQQYNCKNIIECSSVLKRKDFGKDKC